MRVALLASLKMKKMVLSVNTMISGIMKPLESSGLDVIPQPSFVARCVPIGSQLSALKGAFFVCKLCPHMGELPRSSKETPNVLSWSLIVQLLWTQSVTQSLYVWSMQRHVSLVKEHAVWYKAAARQDIWYMATYDSQNRGGDKCGDMGI